MPTNVETSKCQSCRITFAHVILRKISPTAESDRMLVCPTCARALEGLGWQLVVPTKHDAVQEIRKEMETTTRFLETHKMTVEEQFDILWSLSRKTFNTLEGFRTKSDIV